MNEITDKELWTLFTGNDELPDYFGCTNGESISGQKQCELEAIKTFIVDAPKLINPDYILRLAYFRKLMFEGKDARKNNLSKLVLCENVK